MSFSLSGNKSRVEGEIFLSGDKSITHRALFLSAISPGKTLIENFPASEDCLCTLKILNQLGIKSRLYSKSKIAIFGKGLQGLNKPSRNIYIKESGTTFRLLLGILAGQSFTSKLNAGESLSKRPMSRATRPLRLMGAQINSKLKTQSSKLIEEYPPISIRGGNLKGITYKMPVASAQVKSAILLAGLYSSGLTKVVEPVKTRDHTERMLKLFKADIRIKGDNITLKGGRLLISPKNIFLPGDISSASFFLVLASIISGSKLTVKNVGLNPTRSGIVKVLSQSGI
jgi:3-phosphoshikimate 1-carboxyvinyltransferase